MKYFFLALAGFLNAGASLSAQASLTVNVQDIEAAGDGALVVLLFNSADDFGKQLDGAIQKATLTDFGNSATHTFSDLPPGEYAVMVFQDLNQNGTLDKNFIGFPKEPIAASNMTGMRRPTFKRSAITLGSTPVSTEIKLFNQ